jgi:hypothetical protein
VTLTVDVIITFVFGPMRPKYGLVYLLVCPIQALTIILDGNTIHDSKGPHEPHLRDLHGSSAHQHLEELE